jgi:hypothetical protein
MDGSPAFVKRILVIEPVKVLIKKLIIHPHKHSSTAELQKQLK